MPVTGSDQELRRLLHGLPPIEPVGVEAHAAALATTPLRGAAKAAAIDLAIRLVDLTSLEATDTAATIRTLCTKALHPSPGDPTCPPVAAVCVYPDLVAEAATALKGTPVGVASVATAFPSGRAPLETRLAETRHAVEAGATEIDMVIDRGAFLAGRYLSVHDEIAAVKDACGEAHLKVILETGELATYEAVQRASWLAMLAGADFIKTSTGKTTPAATLPVTLVMLRSAVAYLRETGRRVGVKPAGGIRTARQALGYLVAVDETCGGDGLDPRWFRFGASSLLDDLLAHRTSETPASQR